MNIQEQRCGGRKRRIERSKFRKARKNMAAKEDGDLKMEGKRNKTMEIAVKGNRTGDRIKRQKSRRRRQKR